MPILPTHLDVLLRYHSIDRCKHTVSRGRIAEARTLTTMHLDHYIWRYQRDRSAR